MATAAKNRYASPRLRARNDAYVGLLTISLLALVTSCVLLYLDYSDYGAQKPTYVPNVPKSAGNVSLPSDAARPADTGPAEAPAPMDAGSPAPMGGGPMGGGPMGAVPMGAVPMGAVPMGGGPGLTPMGGTPMLPMGGPPGPRPMGGGAGPMNPLVPPGAAAPK